MSTVVIMPGGFHPFHAGHLALYQSAQRAFPDAEVFVAATNDTSARPFPFAVKEKLARLAGVDAGHFVQVKSPFRAEEITAQFNPARDTLIFVRSDKDANKPPQAGGIKKDGNPAYLQPLMGAKKLEPFAKHAYMAYLPTVEFGPGMTSATEIRGAWPQLNEKRKTALVMSLYPATQKNPKLAANVVKLLDTAMGSQVDEDLSRRGFLRGLGAAAVAGAAGSAMAQSQPVDVSQAFANMRKDDPRVQHNKDIDEMARAIYDQMVTLRGQPIDRRQQQMWMTIAREKAAEKLSKYAPGRPAAQSQSSGFPSQGSERRVSKNIDNFESQGMAEAVAPSQYAKLYHSTPAIHLDGILQSGYLAPTGKGYLSLTRDSKLDYGSWGGEFVEFDIDQNAVRQRIKLEPYVDPTTQTGARAAGRGESEERTTQKIPLKGFVTAMHAPTGWEGDKVGEYYGGLLKKYGVTIIYDIVPKLEEQGVAEVANTAGAGMKAGYQARENQPVIDYMEESRS